MAASTGRGFGRRAVVRVGLVGWECCEIRVPVNAPACLFTGTE